jgi:hypothetical protein
MVPVERRRDTHLSKVKEVSFMTIPTRIAKPGVWVGAFAAAVLLALAAPASAATTITLIQVSSDPYTNASSQHATELEPDTFANGSTIVAAFQVGRFFNGGATNIGFARSGDGGATWTHGFLSGLTATSGDPGTTGGPFERVSDPTVAFDAKHHVWLISSIPLLPNRVVPVVFVNRSNNGVNWSGPVTIPPPPVNHVNLDKNWTACDNTPTSPFYGHCYTEFDNFAETDLEYMSTSTDGGLTWSVPVAPAGNPRGLGGQPVVQPNGTVIVPFETITGNISAFRSTDGGQTWSKASTISRIAFHPVAGDLRTSPLPSAEIDGAGKVYTAWEDCRFRASCSSNDIVFSTSSDGVNWSAVTRVPIDDVTSTVDHFIPGLGVDRATSGSGAHLALTYYYYPDAACTVTTCQLEVGFISSPSGGATWGPPTTPLAGPMSLADIAATSQGPMVGDYISTSFTSAGTAVTVFAVGKPHTGPFDEAMYSPGPLAVASAADATRVASSDRVLTPATGQGLGAAVVHRN